MINFNQTLVYKCHVDMISQHLDIPSTKIHGYLRRKFNYSSYKKLTTQQYQTALDYMREHFELLDFNVCQENLEPISPVAGTTK